MKRTQMLVLLSVLLLAFGACESDSGGSSGGTGATADPDEGKTVTATIKAADGGVVKTESGNATIDIPAGALADDTEITIAVMPAEAATASSVYDFGPDGQQFQKAVTISLAFDGHPGTDKKAVLGYYDEDPAKWKEVPNSALAGGVVSGDVNHFSKYAIIIVDDQVVLVSDCADLLTDFNACGGSPIGDWDFDAVCFPPEALGENPMAESCPTATMEFDMTWDATITFTADGTSSVLFAGQSVDIVYDIPLSCLTAPMSCAVLAQQLESPCEEKGGSCVCNVQESDVNENPEPELGTWSVDGTNLVMTDNDGEVQNNPFCVNGDEMHVKIVEPADPDEPGDMPEEFVVVLKKK